VKLSLVPSESEALFRLKFLGQSTSDTVGLNGLARIVSEGITDLTAEKDIKLSAKGIQPLPTQSHATTTKDVQTSVNEFISMFVPPEFINQKARERIMARRPEAERIAAQRAEQRFNQNMDDKVDTGLDKAQKHYLNHVRYPLLRHDMFPTQVDLRTTADALQLATAVRGRDQLAVNDSPPPASKDAEFTVSIHQSTINNLLDMFLAGKEINERDLGRILERILGVRAKSADTGDEQDDEDIGLVFAEQRPLRVTIDENLVMLTYRAQPQSAEKTDTPAEFTVRYHVTQTDSIPHIERLEDEPSSRTPTSRPSRCHGRGSSCGKHCEIRWRIRHSGRGSKRPIGWAVSANLSLPTCTWITVGCKSPAASLSEACPNNALSPNGIFHSPREPTALAAGTADRRSNPPFPSRSVRNRQASVRP